MLKNSDLPLISQEASTSTDIVVLVVPVAQIKPENVQDQLVISTTQGSKQ